jgi:hypothetical protein
LAFQVPFPRDGDNLVSKIDQSEKEEDTKLSNYLKGIAKLTEDLKAEVRIIQIQTLNFETHKQYFLSFYLSFVYFSNLIQKFKLTNIPPLEEMTKELEIYYFPERAPTYKGFVEDEDLYAKMLEDKKKGGHH